MFTDRFIKVPIRIYSKKQYEITGKEEYEDSWFKFLPFELATYRPTSSDNNDDGHIWTTIMLKSGDETTLNITTKEFEKLLNEHQK